MKNSKQKLPKLWKTALRIDFLDHHDNPGAKDYLVRFVLLDENNRPITWSENGQEEEVYEDCTAFPERIERDGCPCCNNDLARLAGKLITMRRELYEDEKSRRH